MYIKAYWVLITLSIVLTLLKLSGLIPFFTTLSWWRVLAPIYVPWVTLTILCFGVALALILSWGGAILIKIAFGLGRQPNYQSKTIL